MSKQLQAALISGPAYDPLYECLPRFSESSGIKVDVAFSGDHPAINSHLAALAQVMAVAFDEFRRRRLEAAAARIKY